MAGRASERPVPTAGGLALVLANLTAFALAVAAPVAAVNDLGQITVAPWLQTDATRTLLLQVAGWLAAAHLLRGRPLAVHLARVLSLLLITSAIASTAGRAQGLVAWAAAMAAHAALVRWEPATGYPQRQTLVAWSALPVLVAASLAWLEVGSLPLTLGLLAGALVLVDLRHRRPEAFAFEHAARVRAQSTAVAAWTWLRTLAGRGRAAVVAMEIPERTRQAATQAWGRLLIGIRDPELVLAFVASMILMGLIAYRYSSQPPSVLGSADYENHLWYSDRASIWPFQVSVPHPGFHQSVAALRSVLGRTWASTVLLAVASGVVGAQLVGIARRRFGGRPGLPAWWGLGFAVAVIFADTPALIARALHVGNPWDWAPAARMVLSPTDTLLLPFAIATVVLVARAVTRDRASAPDLDPVAALGSPWPLAAVTLAGSLVKPSLLLALLPGLAGYLVVSRRSSRRLLRHLSIGLLAPAAVAIGWQVWFLTTGPGDFEGSQIAIAPLATIRQVGIDRASPLLVSHLLVVPLALWVDRRRYLGSPTIAILLWSLLASFGLMLLLEEQGPRGGDGNFAKPAFIVGSLLFVFTWRYVLGAVAERRASGEGRALWFVPAVALGATCLVAGVLGYLEAVGLLALPTRGVAT